MRTKYSLCAAFVFSLLAVSAQALPLEWTAGSMFSVETTAAAPTAQRLPPIPTPEPGSMLLLGCGLFGLARLVKDRREPSTADRQTELR